MGRLDRVSSASISLDGSEVLGASDFNRNVPLLEAGPASHTGPHDLSIRLASAPGSTLSLEVTWVPDDRSPRDPVAGVKGRLVAFNLFDDPDPFSPADQNGVRDFSYLGADVRVQSLPGWPGDAFRFFLRWQFELAGGSACGSERILAGETDVPGTVTMPIRIAWDGKDGTGAWAADGPHFYRLRAELYREHKSGGGLTLLDRAVTQIQAVTVDNTPPTVTIYQRPQLRAGGGPAVQSGLAAALECAAGDLGDSRREWQRLRRCGRLPRLREHGHRVPVRCSSYLRPPHLPVLPLLQMLVKLVNLRRRPEITRTVNSLHVQFAADA
ncbi:MAG: hypothetical protein HY828_18440 [Actinobacteria bacterium]|nr:hypothetical protein [Actinomycetota bacterium]